MSPPPPDLSVAVALSATASVRSKVFSFPFCLGSSIQFVTACTCKNLGLLALGALTVALGLSEIAFMLTANDMVTESWPEWLDPCAVDDGAALQLGTRSNADLHSTISSSGIGQFLRQHNNIFIQHFAEAACMGWLAVFLQV